MRKRKSDVLSDGKFWLPLKNEMHVDGQEETEEFCNRY